MKLLTGTTLAICAIFCPRHCFADEVVTTARVAVNYGKLPLSFEANDGQMDSRVKFRSRGSSYALFIAQDEVVLTLRRKRKRILSQAAGAKAVVRMRLIGEEPGTAVTGTDQLPGTSNYLIGNDPKKWRTNVANYAKVKYSGVYPGVDLVYYGNQGGELEYDFVVAPGADPAAIRFALSGMEDEPRGPLKGRKLKFKIDLHGDLVIKTRDGEVRFHEPVIYQNAVKDGQRTRVDGDYVLRGGSQVGFTIGAYDHSKPLFIDPVLSYATYLGGSVEDIGAGIAVDSSGNAYVTGATLSADFPTVNPIQAACNGVCANGGDVFVAKLNADGSALVYSTFLGGGGGDAGQAIAVDSSGDAYVAGYTESTDFPTVNPIQANNLAQTGETGFVAKLNAEGSALLYSTYLGGTFQTRCFGIGVDSSGSAYVTGATYYRGFPTTPGAFQTAGSTSPAFVAKLTADGSGLAYSTFIGGSGVDQGRGIAVDSSGSAYITGITQSDGQSADFPTVNPIQATTTSGGTAFVSKLNSDGSSLVYSTYLGGSSMDEGQGIAVDSSGNAYVTGGTISTDFPTVNAFQATCESCSPSSPSAFVAKLNAAGSALVYSTYLGGNGGAGGLAIAVDSSGNAYVTGAASDGFPIANAFQDACNAGFSCVYGGGSAFVTELNAAGSALVYSTYLGGSLAYGNGIATDSNGNVYLTGQTRGNFPVVNALQPLPRDSGYGTGFVAKISPANLPAASILTPSLTFSAQAVGTSSAAQTVTLLDVGSAPLSISSIVASGDFSQTNSCGAGISVSSSCAIAVTFTPTAAGSRTGSITITDNSNGAPTQTVALSGTGLANVAVMVGANLPGVSFTVDGTPYSSSQTFTWVSGSSHTLATTSPQIPAPGAQYLFSGWSDGGAISHTVTAAAGTTSYTVAFQTQYSLTTAANPVAGGTVSAGGYFNAGTAVTVTAVPNTGYNFAGWTGLVASPSSASSSVSMTGPQSVTANFAAVAKAAYVGVDSTTQGTWTGSYGADGYVIANGASNVPAYATAGVTGDATYTWAGSTTDVRGLQTASGASARIASTYYSGNSFSINVNLLDGNTHRVALYLLDWDSTSRIETVSIIDAESNTVLDTEGYASFPAGEYAIWNLKGNVIIEVTKTSGANAVVAGIFFDPATAPAVVKYSGLNTATQGTWSGEYGADGGLIANGTAVPPAYATVSLSGDAAYTWTASTSDVRALQTASGATSRIASAFYSFCGFSINVNLTDGNTHRIALYLLDWDTAARTETISILDANTHVVLDTETFASFHNGEYASWNVQGQVVIQVEKTGGANAVVSGIFFDPPANPGGATYVGSDNTTQGTWTGVYGSTGEIIVNDANNTPAFATFAVTADSTYTWAASSADVRALQTASGASTRIASTFYSLTGFTFDLNITDGNAHKISLYLLDWDSTSRAQTIKILDANTNAVLDSETYSEFQNGEYAVWSLKGHILIQVTKTGGANAVVSGIFFD